MEDLVTYVNPDGSPIPMPEVTNKHLDVSYFRNINRVERIIRASYDSFSDIPPWKHSVDRHPDDMIFATLQDYLGYLFKWENEKKQKLNIE